MKKKSNSLPWLPFIDLEVMGDMALILFILWSLIPTRLSLLLLLSFFFLIWKSVQKAWSSWMTLNYKHQILQEEERAIDLQREIKKEELIKLYVEKGVPQQLAEEISRQLSDHSLLKILLEEKKLLQQQKHPLQESRECAIGILLATALFLLGYALNASWGPWLSTIFTLTLLSSKARTSPVHPIIWHLSTLLLIAALSTSLKKMVAL